MGWNGRGQSPKFSKHGKRNLQKPGWGENLEMFGSGKYQNNTQDNHSS